MIKENIKIIVTLIIIFGLIMGIVLYFSLEKNSDKLSKVDTPNAYFTAINYSNYYINNISTKNTDVIYDILDEKYISNNEINRNNIFEKITNYPENSSVENTEIKYLKLKTNYIFYIKGKVYQEKSNEEELIDEDYAIIIIIDSENEAFSIYPTSNNEYKNIINKIKKIKISKNNNNNLIPTELIKKEKMCILYMNDFVNKIYNSSDNGYNLLNDKTKEQYNNLENYQQIINSNLDKFTTVADKCAIKSAMNRNNENNKIYNVIDENGNKFIFTENAIMDYKVDFELNNEEE